MVKLFRKVRQVILAEHKFSKYLLYATGEIVLVVIGILIALQINNWNLEQQRQQEEQRLLVSLKKDLETSITQLERKIIATQAIQKTDSTTLVLIKQKNKSVGKDSLMHLLVSYFGPPTFDPDDGTIEEIKNTGKSIIISNPALRQFIASWTSYMQEIKEMENLFDDLYFNIKLPYLSKCVPLRNNRIDRFEPSDYEIVESAIFSSIEFENLVFRSWSTCANLKWRYILMRGELNRIVSILEAEIIQ